MAFNKYVSSVLIVLLATGSAYAFIDGCAAYGTPVNNVETCVRCSPGYFSTANASVCIPCVGGCQNCAATGSCNICANGGTLFNGVCSTCGNNCAVCQPNGCSVCNSGYGLNSFGSCEQCAENCAVCDNSMSCSVCANGYRRIRDRTDQYGVCVGDRDEIKKTWTWITGAGIIVALLLPLLFLSKAPLAPTYNPFDGDRAVPVGFTQQGVIPVQTTTAQPVVTTTTPVFTNTQVTQNVPVRTAGPVFQTNPLTPGRVAPPITTRLI